MLAFFAVGCGSGPVAQPFVAKANQKDEAKVVVKSEVKKRKENIQPNQSKKKLLAGKVTFAKLSEKELSDFRVIPETGKTLLTPKNQSYEQVDGFWWKGMKGGEWFKIPGSSEVWVGKGEAPEGFEGTAHQGDLKIHYRSNGLVKVVGFLKQGVKRPSWVANQGRTQSPVPSPWVEEAQD